MSLGLAFPRWPFRASLAALTPVIASLLALFAALALGLRLPATVSLSAWPEPLFDVSLTLTADRVSWLFGLAILSIAVAVFLTGLARSGPPLGSRLASLLVAAAALAAVQAENLVTLAITWSALDTLYFLSLILPARDEKIEGQAALSLMFNVLATFGVIAAALDTLHEGQPLLLSGHSAFTDRGVGLLLFAALFRLGVFPFHLGLPGEASNRQGLNTMLRLAPAVAALALLTHVVGAAPELPFRLWLSAAACLGLLISAVQWWGASDPRQGIGYAVLAHSSLALLAILWGGAQGGMGALAIGLAAVLGGAALFLSNGFNDSERAWVIPSLLAAFVLAGGPLTIGYIGAVIVYSGLIASGAWVLFILCVLGQALLAASYLRLALWPGAPVSKSEPITGLAYLFGMAIPLLFAVLSGLAPASIAQAAGAPPPDLFAPQSLTALGAVTAAILGGVGLPALAGRPGWRFESLLRARAESAWTAVSAAVRLDWLYQLTWDVYRFIGRMLRVAAAVIEGEGGVLWVIVAALLVWLLFQGK